MSVYVRLHTSRINFDTSKGKTGLVAETAADAPLALAALNDTAERQKVDIYDVKVVETGHARQVTAYGTAVWPSSHSSD